MIHLGQVGRDKLQRILLYVCWLSNCVHARFLMPKYNFCPEDPYLTLHTPQILESWTSLLILCCVSVSTPIVTYPMIPFSIFSPSRGTI